MSYPCTDDPNEIISSIIALKAKQESLAADLEKIDRYVNGGVYEEVQLGEGEPTPTLRNLSHLVKSAAAELDGSDVSGKLSDAANGGETLRMLADRFGDVVNVKDFGAVGDGVADDTAAFSAATATGKTVFVPEGEYSLSSHIAGNFVSTGYVGCGFVTVKDLSLPELAFPDASCLNRVGVDWGGSKPDFDGAASPYMWDRATQGHHMDIWDGVLYVGGTSSSGMERMAAVKWATNEEDRTVLGISEWYEPNTIWQHQDNCVYRPHPKDPVKFLAGSYQAGFTLKLIAWDYRNPAVATVEKTFTAFPSASYNLNRQTALAVSADSRWIVMRARRASDEKDVYKVWDAKKTLSLPSGTDISSLCEWEFAEPDGNLTYSSGGQGIFSDGRYIYALYGYSKAMCRVFTLDGKNVFDTAGTDPLFGTKTLYGTEYQQIVAEPESFFWALVNGRMEAFYAISYMAYTDSVNYRRFDRYICMSQSGDENGIVLYSSTPVQRIDDFNSVVSSGVYGLTWADISPAPENTPPGMTNCLLHVLGSRNNSSGDSRTEFARQVAYRIGTPGTNDYNVFTRGFKRNVDGTVEGGDWVRFLMAKGVADIHGLPTGNSFVRMYDENDDAAADSYGFIAHGRSSSGDLSSEAVELHTRLGFIAGGETSAVGLYAHSSGASQGEKFFHNSDAVCQLGTSNHRWSDIHASSGTIITSDARAKDNFADPQDERLMHAWGRVRFKIFQMKDALERKGEAARLHVGLVAQEVAAAFAAEGLDASRYGLFCHDEWGDEYEPVDQSPAGDGGGQASAGRRLLTKAGDRYAIRYDEALALECAYQRWRLEQIEARLNEISSTIVQASGE